MEAFNISVFFFDYQLLEKDPNTRLGAASSPHGEITESVFFNEIDWKKLERRALEPPFRPQVVSTFAPRRKCAIFAIFILN